MACCAQEMDRKVEQQQQVLAAFTKQLEDTKAAALQVNGTCVVQPWHLGCGLIIWPDYLSPCS